MPTSADFFPNIRDTSILREAVMENKDGWKHLTRVTTLCKNLTVLPFPAKKFILGKTSTHQLSRPHFLAHYL